MSEDREPGTDVPPRGRDEASSPTPDAGAPDARAPQPPPRPSWPPAPLPSPFGPSGWTERPTSPGGERGHGPFPQSNGHHPPEVAEPGAGLGASLGPPSGAAAGPPQGPPPRGPGIFSLEGRAAPGLYVLAWLLALVGFGLVVVGASAASNTATGKSAGPGPIALAIAGVVALTLSAATAAGYQVIARRWRPPYRYRGPSPLYVFVVIVLGVVLASAPLAATGVLDRAASIAAVASEGITVAGYLLAIWLFAVRTGALSWAAMGWPTDARVTLRRLAGDVVMGIGLVVPAYFATVIVAALLASVLNATTPEVLPPPRSSADVVATIIAAVVLAPIGEEAFFRGFALTAWWRDLGVNSALLRATLMFAAAHILNVTATTFDEGLRTAILQFAVIVPVGYVLGWLFTQRGILASIAGHMTFNSIAVILLVATSAPR